MDNNKLIELALKTADNAYAPYSNFQVGAVIEFEDGSIFKGCNVENASYGLCFCAERNAISTAISEGKKDKILKIAIASPNANKCFPCGACRQWIEELAPESEIIVQDKNTTLSFTAKELLPHSFDSSYLK